MGWQCFYKLRHYNNPRTDMKIAPNNPLFCQIIDDAGFVSAKTNVEQFACHEIGECYNYIQDLSVWILILQLF